MKVLIDKYIPFINGVLEPCAEVEYLSDDSFTPDRVRQADALIIRTTVRCDERLLSGSRVCFIATATIGTDHIDTAYCSSHGIAVASAPGCNAQAVCDYICEVLNSLSALGRSVQTLGVVGVGHVGTLVAAMARERGIRVLLNDPPKQIGIPLSELLPQCDAVTFHTPLTRSGDFPTYHLCDAALLSLCRPGTVIVNAARGGIIDESALLASGLPCVIDCWEGEPHLNRNLLASEQTLLASYHIAGYSLQGKLNATNQCIRAFCDFFGFSACKSAEKVVSLQADSILSEKGDSAPGWLGRITELLKAQPDNFVNLRKQYKLR